MVKANDKTTSKSSDKMTNISKSRTISKSPPRLKSPLISNSPPTSKYSKSPPTSKSLPNSKSPQISKSSDYLEEGGVKKVKPTTFARYRYSKYWDFLFSCMGATVGYGNIAGFPLSAIKYGGVYYVLVCVLIAVFVTIPLCCLEMFLGQLSGVGIARTLSLMSPLFQGVGWAMIGLTYIQCLTYGIYISRFMVFFFKSFQPTMLWTLCDQPWNTENCFSSSKLQYCVNWTDDNSSDCFRYYNKSSNALSTKEFYTYYVQGATHPGKGDESGLMVDLCVATLFCYLMIFLCLMFGIRISSKVAYITVVFPYLGILILLIACLTQDGGFDGIKTFFVPNFSELKPVREGKYGSVFTTAISHLIWSANIGTGVVTAMTSYNPFHNNCKRDAVVIVLLDIFTSFLACLCVYAGSGIVAKSMDLTTVKFLEVYGGAGISYVIYPEILSRLPSAMFWSLLFFLIMIVLGFDTIIWHAETCITEIADVYHPCRAGRPRIVLVAVFCVLSYCIGLTFCLKGKGVLNFSAVYSSIQGYQVMLFALLEIVAVFYIYGYKRFALDISLIIGTLPNLLWKSVFLVTAPLALLVLLIMKVFDPISVKYLGKMLAPSYQILAAIISACLTSIVLVFTAYLIVRKFIQKKRSIILLLMPSHKWCPRKKSDMEVQRKEIEAAELGIMGDFEKSIGSRKSKVFGA